MKNELDKFCKNISFKDFNYAVNISLCNKYIYVETPKVACSSIKLILQRIELEDTNLERDMETIHNREFSPLLKPTQIGDFSKLINSKDFYKFCFVRNPYTRLLSAYLDKIAPNKENTFRKHYVFTQLGLDFRSKENKVSFKDFVKCISSHPIELMDPHWRPQYYQTLQDFINYDFIGRFESISKDIDSMVRKIAGRRGRKYITQSRVHKTNANSLVENYYTKEIRDMVYTKYKKDFDYFGYSPVLEEISLNKAEIVKESNIKSKEEMLEIFERTHELEDKR